MLYILESTHHKHVAHQIHPARVESWLELLTSRMDSGHIVGAYTKAGGGALAIVEYPDEQALFNRLRQLSISGVTVTPVFDTTEVLATYHAHHKASGAYDEAHQDPGIIDAAKAKARELHEHSTKAYQAAKGGGTPTPGPSTPDASAPPLVIVGSRYTITGVVKRAGGAGGLEVAAYDKDLVTGDDKLGDDNTSATGQFKISFDTSDFTDWGLDRKPDLYFKIYERGKLIHTTKPIANADPSIAKIVIDLDC